ncbi:hypothetical protein F4804DRAFT_353352 [Jackrogersella minutella]|nr:hypothetical protein F4804DRAFT_353352 [Jackrogersella minutella]
MAQPADNTNTSKPIIFQFSLGEKWEQDTVKLGAKSDFSSTRTIKKLIEVATIQPAWNAKQGIDLLKKNHSPHAILITDPGIMKPENQELSRRMIDYVRGGGTVIFSFLFPTALFDTFSLYMKQWDLRWEIHSYNCYKCSINTSAEGRPGSQWMLGLPAIYDYESIYFRNVAPEDCWYLVVPKIDGHGREEGVEVPPPEKQTPVAFSKVGKGFLGLTGDMSQHDATDAVVLSMLGINDPVKWCSCEKDIFDERY